MRYNSSMRHSRGLRNSSNKSSSLFMPFVILICIGIIGVLGFKLYSSLTEAEPEKGVKIDVLAGSADLKAWGTEQFVNIPGGSFLMEGDEIQTSSDSLLSLEFPEGSIIRLSGGADLILEDLSIDKEPYNIKLLLVNGDLWLNKMTNTKGVTHFEVSLGNVVVKSRDLSILSLENKLDEVVRVVSGASASVDVLNEAKEKVVETVTVAVGQEAYFTDSVLQKYWNYESPSILAALSDEFRDSEFYDFNLGADKGVVDVYDTETDVSVSSTEESSSVESDLDDSSSDDVDTPAEVSESSVVNNSTATQSNVSAPKITSVAGISKTDENGFFVVTNYLATLTGTVSGASEVFVNDYKLQKFVSGSNTWSYFANAKYNLMKEGENIYNVYAKDANGNKSEVLTVKVLYKPLPQVSAPVSTPTTETSTETASESSESSTETPTETSTETTEDPSQMPDWL